MAKKIIHSHIDAIEQILIAKSQIANNPGHPVLRGGPREWFLREFLDEHLPAIYEIGQGEIIHADSLESPSTAERPQIDIVIYRKDLPKIVYSRNDMAFLAEGVMAIVEVKSTLTKEEFRVACIKSKKIKNLQRERPLHAMGAEFPEKIPSYLIAYSCERKIATVAKWFSEISKELETDYTNLIDVVSQAIS